MYSSSCCNDRAVQVKRDDQIIQQDLRMTRLKIATIVVAYAPKFNVCDLKIYLGASVGVQIIVEVRPDFISLQNVR